MATRDLSSRARASKHVDKLGMQRRARVRRRSVDQVFTLPGIGTDVVELCKVDFVEDVLFIPLNVGDVVRVVDNAEHSPLVVRVVINGKWPISLRTALGKLARETRAPAGRGYRLTQQQRCHALSIHERRHRQPCKIKHCGRDVNVRYDLLKRGTRFDSGPLDEERDANIGLIREHFLNGNTMLTEMVAVAAHSRERGSWSDSWPPRSDGYAIGNEATGLEAE